MNILETDSIQLAFNGQTILNNVYLSCRTGEIVGLVGRNGSGKSSLMKLIFGTLRGDAQSVRINKKYYSHAYRQGARLMYLPQDGFLPGYLRVADVRKLFKWKEDPCDDFEELNDLGNTKISDLSGGQKKLLEVLALLYGQAEFLLLDEPFSFLAPVTVEKLTPHIIHQSGKKGILLTDHMYRTVLDTCHRIYLVQTGVLREIKDTRVLIDMGYLPEE